MPAFPGWEMPRIEVPQNANSTPFAAGARLSAEGVAVGIGLPASAFKLVCESVSR